MTDVHFDDLELDGDALRALVARATERLAARVDALPELPARDLADAEERARELIEPMPERGSDVEAVLDVFFDRALPKGLTVAGPGYLAYIPGGGLLHSAVAGFVAAAANPYVGVWLPAPGAVQLEANVVRWFAGMVGYPPTARGALTSGGSLANFSAVVTARRARLPDDFSAGTMYVSDQVHHSVAKAAMLAGFPSDALRVIPSDPDGRLLVDELRQRVASDRDAGRVPFLVVASAGTVHTGAVDDLERVADVAAKDDLWLHVDAAYGGFFLLTDRGRRAMRGIERSDSVTMDPHKGLFLPYGTGCLLVQDGAALRRAHTVEAAYLPKSQDDPDFWDFSDLSPELSRPFRGLGVWLPFKLIGAGAFRRALDEKLDLAAWAADRLHEIPGLEVVAEPQLSTVAFRAHLPGLDDEATDRLNRTLLDSVDARRRVYLTGTTFRGRFVIRICVLSFRTHRDRIEMAIEDIKTALADLAR